MTCKTTLRRWLRRQRSWIAIRTLLGKGGSWWTKLRARIIRWIDDRWKFDLD
jgi:hypothetical protein